MLKENANLIVGEKCQLSGVILIEKQLLSIKELCSYLNIGQTKARELVRGRNGFGVQIGNRWYANKSKVDEWIEKNSIYLPITIYKFALR